MNSALPKVVGIIVREFRAFLSDWLYFLLLLLIIGVSVILSGETANAFESACACEWQYNTVPHFTNLIVVVAWFPATVIYIVSNYRLFRNAVRNAKFIVLFAILSVFAFSISGYIPLEVKDLFSALVFASLPGIFAMFFLVAFAAVKWHKRSSEVHLDFRTFYGPKSIIRFLIVIIKTIVLIALSVPFMMIFVFVGYGYVVLPILAVIVFVAIWVLYGLYKCLCVIAKAYRRRKAGIMATSRKILINWRLKRITYFIISRTLVVAALFVLCKCTAVFLRLPDEKQGVDERVSVVLERMHDMTTLSQDAVALYRNSVSLNGINSHIWLFVLGTTITLMLLYRRHKAYLAIYAAIMLVWFAVYAIVLIPKALPTPLLPQLLNGNAEVSKDLIIRISRATNQFIAIQYAWSRLFTLFSFLNVCLALSVLFRVGGRRNFYRMVYRWLEKSVLLVKRLRAM